MFFISLFNKMEIYCVKERKSTPSVPGSETYERARHGRLMLKAKCASWGITKNRFVSEKTKTPLN